MSTVESGFMMSCLLFSGVWLYGGMPTAISDFIVSCLRQCLTQWCLTPWHHAYSGVVLKVSCLQQSRTKWCCAYSVVRLHYVMPTAESDSIVSCLQRSLTSWCHAYSGVWLNGVMPIQQSMSQWCHSCSGVWLHGFMLTRSRTQWCYAHSGVWLHGGMPTQSLKAPRHDH